MKFVVIFTTALTLSTDCCAANNNCTENEHCRIHYALVSIAGVITVILFIAVIMCIIITCVLAKGVRFMTQYFSASVTDRANGEYDMTVHQTQQQEQQNEVAQQSTVDHTPEPQYDCIENEQAQVHYFELEPPPQHINTKAKQQNKPMNKGAMAMSKLYSLPELATPMELPGEEYSSPNTVNYPGQQKQKVSAVSLPPSITKYSTNDVPEQEKAEEPIPIYSIPDKSKKSVNTTLEPIEHEERETEQLSRSHTLDSFFNIKTQITVEEGGDEGRREGSSTPPPPLLPPKPGQTKNKATEDAGESEESVYAEASSKPLQVHPQRKTVVEWSDSVKTATVTAMGNISPFHLHARYFQKEQGHTHKRSLSAVDDMKRKEAHSRARLPARTGHDQLYDTALSLLESKEEEEEKLRVKNEDGIQ